MIENCNESFMMHAIIEGYVQGVGFRYYVKDNAELLGLTGWVRNLYNGSVEVTAEGDRKSLEKLVEALKLGPSRSIVTSINTDWLPSEGNYSQFSFLPTE